MFNWYIFKPKILTNYFQESVRYACSKCKRYNNSASCPPFIESIEFYKQTLNTFQHGLLFIKKYKIHDISQWQKLGKESSEDVRQELELMQNILKNQGFSVLIFGAGSCKICIICSIPCKNLSKRLIPIEATGLNIIRLVAKITKKQIKFPVEKQGFFYRVGVILWHQ